ncbi:MAG: protein kinase [Myxococcales bacterium]|nr:protein kinase [Myxococcales bacterium]
MSTTIGKVLNHTYRLEKALSEGGMGQVFVASHMRIQNRHFAVKRLRPELAASERFLARFRIEAQAMMALEHPNIVRIEDFLEDEHTYYLVMEFIRGRPLDEILFFQKRLSLAQIVSISMQILGALERCHAQHIIHRDLKPSNVLVEESGQIKLTDFGIALQEDLGSRLTNTGTLLGTPDYMSPEQITSKEMDGRSDLYSLGVMMYEMLAGRLPFPRTEESEGSYVILYAHVHTPPPPIPDETVPPFLREATFRCLAKHPEERFRNAADMREFLLQHIPSEGWLLSRETKEEVSALALGIKNPEFSSGPSSSRASAALLAFTQSPQAASVPQEPETAAFERDKHHQEPTHLFVGHDAPTPPVQSLPTAQPLAEQLRQHYTPAQPTSTKKSGGKGILVFFVVLLLAGAGGGWWWWLQDGGTPWGDAPKPLTRKANTEGQPPTHLEKRLSDPPVQRRTLGQTTALVGDPEPVPQEAGHQDAGVPPLVVIPEEGPKHTQPDETVAKPDETTAQPDDASQQDPKVPDMRQSPPPQKRPVLRRGVPLRREPPVLRKAPVRRDIPLVREVPVRRDVPLVREPVLRRKVPVRRDIPLVREVPVRRDLPLVREVPVRRDPVLQREVPVRRAVVRRKVPVRRVAVLPPPRKSVDPLEARKRALLRSITWPKRVPELCQEFLDTCLWSCFLRRQRSYPTEAITQRLISCKAECWRLRGAIREVRDMCGIPHP